MSNITDALVETKYLIFYFDILKTQFLTLTLNQMFLFSREYRPRENVTFLENGTKIFATNPKSFVFLRNMSVGDPEVDHVITVNIPYIVRIIEHFSVRNIFDIF